MTRRYQQPEEQQQMKGTFTPEGDTFQMSPRVLFIIIIYSNDVENDDHNEAKWRGCTELI